MAQPSLDHASRLCSVDDSTVHAAWADYTDAAHRAQFSRRIEDGIAAGQAWKAFLDLFVGPAPSNNVVDFRPRASTDRRDAALERVFKLAGRGKLAASLGVTIQAISQWRRVPPLRVLEVERLTDIHRSELRPDLYPASDPPPAEGVALRPLGPSAI